MWATLEDVSNDLASSGLLVADIESSYIVRGEKPPPRCAIEETDEDEMNILFGNYDRQRRIQGRRNSYKDQSNTPDLVGITRMLQLVNTEDDDDIPDWRKKESGNPNNTSHITISKLNPHTKQTEANWRKKDGVKPDNTPQITVRKLNSNAKEPITNWRIKEFDTQQNPQMSSKLNPNVEEFIPRAAKIPSPIMQEPKTEQRITPVIDDKEKQRIEELYRTIQKASQEATLEEKRAKNVALSSLLKIHSVPSPVSPSSSSLITPAAACGSTPQPLQGPSVLPKPIVLFTPEYFSKPARPELTKLPDASNKFSLPSTESSDDDENFVVPPNPLLEPNDSPNPKRIVDPLIKESISKVNNWLNIPEEKKPKPTGPFFGSVVFKKKGDRSPGNTTPSTEVSREVSSPNRPVHTIKQFKPTQHAEEYRKKLEKQVKERQDKEEKLRLSKMSWGDVLEMQLKQKDEEIFKKQREANDSTGTSSRQS